MENNGQRAPPLVEDLSSAAALLQAMSGSLISLLQATAPWAKSSAPSGSGAQPPPAPQQQEQAAATTAPRAALAGHHHPSERDLLPPAARDLSDSPSSASGISDILCGMRLSSDDVGRESLPPLLFIFFFPCKIIALGINVCRCDCVCYTHTLCTRVEWVDLYYVYVGMLLIVVQVCIMCVSL